MKEKFKVVTDGVFTVKEKSSKRNIVTFCLAFLLSAFGYEFIFFIMTLHIYDLTENALNVSVFTVLTFLPKFFSPFYGAIADRYRRQWVLGAAALGTAGLMFLLSFTRDIRAIYVLWFFVSIALTLIANVRSILFAEVLPSENYHAGNSTMLILSNGARILAPLAGGTAALIFPMEDLIYAVCLIYVAAALISSSIQPGLHSAAPDQMDPPGGWRAGFQYIWENASIKYLVGVSLLWRLFLGLQVSLLIVYVKSFLNGNDAQYGYFITLLSVGSILGSFLGSWLIKRVGEKTIITYGLCLHYGTFAALGLTRQYSAACLVIFISFIAFYATLVCMHTVRDRETHSSIRGRVYGTVTALLNPPAILSMLVGGYLAERISVNWVLLSAGVLALFSLAAMTLLMRPARTQVSPSPSV